MSVLEGAVKRNRPVVPEWVISYTDQDAAMSRAVWHAANLTSPALEWDARQGSLFGASVFLHLDPWTPGAEVRAWHAMIVYKAPPLVTLNLSWDTAVGSYDPAQCITRWRMSEMQMSVVPSLPCDPIVYIGRIDLARFVRIAQGIAIVLADGYTFSALQEALQAD